MTVYHPTTSDNFNISCPIPIAVIVGTNITNMPSKGGFSYLTCLVYVPNYLGKLRTWNH